MNPPFFGSALRGLTDFFFYFFQASLAPPSSGGGESSEPESSLQETRVGDTEGTGFALGVVRGQLNYIAGCDRILEKGDLHSKLSF